MSEVYSLKFHIFVSSCLVTTVADGCLSGMPGRADCCRSSIDKCKK